MKTFVVTIVGVLLFLMIGCAAIQDGITPCEINTDVVEYVQKSDPNFVKTKYLPYTTLLDSKRTKAYFDFYHLDNQIGWQRLAEDDKRFYDFATGRILFHQANAEELQQQIFSPEGVVGLLIPSLFAGTLGALLIKRPGDKSPKEVADTLYTEEEVAKIKSEKA